MTESGPLEELKLRTYREADFDALVDLWSELGMARWYNEPRRDIDLWVTSENAEILIAEFEGRLAGSICVGHDGHRGYFYYLAALPSLRRKGVGRRLVEAAEAWLKDRKVPKVQLLVRPTNQQANAFYQSIGYEQNPCRIWQRWLIDRGKAPAEAGEGRLEVTITHLEMTQRPEIGHFPHPSGQSYALLRADEMPLSFYRYLYDAVGRPWVWYERRQWSDEALQGLIHHPEVEVYVLYIAGAPAGFFELDCREVGVVDLGLFGLLPEYVGRKLGPYLLASALDIAWDKGPETVTVNTCTLDHPKALPLYQKMGFSPVTRETIHIDDPRETGLLPPLD